MIDLHTHTTASDGTYSPGELVDAAAAIGLEALSITDHDTFDGFDEAAPLAAERGLRLLCGIEVSTRLPRPGGGRARSVHLLGYFPAGPGDSFRAWIRVQQQIRYERNLALVDRLQELGIDIQYGEVRAIGRNMVARPHFARVMVRKGYVKDLQSAFDEYLDESAIAYVEKHDPGLEEAITEIRRGGGIPSVAHAVRIGLGDAAEVELLQRLIPAGLLAIETWHSDHSVERRRKYQDLAVSLGLLETGGSDFHGANKGDVELGTGRAGNCRAPVEILEPLLSALGV